MLLGGCGRSAVPDPQTVVAEDYDSFWLWAGVKPQPVLDRAQSIYILAGEVRAGDTGRFRQLRPATPDVSSSDLWLVIRVETLEWSPAVAAEIIELAEKWDRQDRPLTGVQIDFDAHTDGLEGYAAFLRSFRQILPGRFKLSITGLLDWSANGDPQGLSALADVVDEAVFQTYQDRASIPGYEQWLERLRDLPMPFRLGLVQGGQWQEPDRLRDMPNFRGFVVFLVNPSRVGATD
ncbi:MAG: hypothetical protein COA41_02985 [Sphingopyxis sp.]|nr:MAG: hypothetical protein COA41_02985 [Sphingopyxis sp.]